MFREGAWGFWLQQAVEKALKAYPRPSSGTRPMPDSAIAEELLHRHADVFRDLTQQRWRNVATLVGRNGGAAATRIAELLMGAPLPDELEAQ